MVAIHLFSLLHSKVIVTDDPHKNNHSPPPPQQQQQHPWIYLYNHSHHQSFIAAALFASHPIHTEAVASIVGHAELLGTFFLLTALLIHLSSIKKWLISRNMTHYAISSIRNSRNGNSIIQFRFRFRSMKSDTTSFVTILVLPTMLAWAAALCKETGITLLGALCIIDIYIMVYGNTSLFVIDPDDAKKKKKRDRDATTTSRNEEEEEEDGSTSDETTTSFDDIKGMLFLLAMVLLYLVVGLGSYIALRKHVSGGDHLVRIYRKVENPIPFAVDSFLTRWLTTAHVHVRYTWLMLVPYNLSADWSYACVEYVSSLGDVRNVGSMVVYGVVVYIGVVSWKMLGLYDFLFNDEDEEEEEERRRREGKGRRWWWSVAVLIGLVVGPFLPASNIFFYVGTFIGERLLYIPSIGYCLLIASWMPTNYLGARRGGIGEEGKRVESKEKKEKNSSDDDDSDDDEEEEDNTYDDNRSIAERTGVPVFNAKTLYISIITFILISYSTKTVRRNRDWRDDATLFTSAGLVCPGSAKVQLNLGILHRRWGRYEAAIHHFQLAEQAEPSGQFCETKFQIAVTLLSNSLAAKVPIDSTMAFTLLEESLSCKYVAAEALKALNDVSLAVTRAGVDAVSIETRVGVAQRWAKTLSRPEISRYGDAIAVCEQASVLQATYSDTISPFCLDLLKTVRQQVVTDYTAYMMTRNSSDSGQQQQQQRSSSLSVDWPLKQDPPLSTSTFTTLYTCVAARHQLIQYAAAHKLEGAGISLEAKNVWYTYLNINRKLGCRHLPIHTGNNIIINNIMGIHPQLVHMAQSTDANDPWLQEEWGLILSHDKARLVEAYQHTSAAAYLLTQKLQHMLHGKNSGTSQGGHGGMLSLASNGTEPLTSPHEAMEGLERTTEMGLGIIRLIMMKKSGDSRGDNDNDTRHEEQEQRLKLQSVMCQLKKMECHGMEMMASLGPDEEKLHWEREALRCEEQVHGGGDFCAGGGGGDNHGERQLGGYTLSDEL